MRVMSVAFFLSDVCVGPLPGPLFLIPYVNYCYALQGGCLFGRPVKFNLDHGSGSISACKCSRSTILVINHFD